MAFSPHLKTYVCNGLLAEFEILEEKPYKFKIVINSNVDTEDNHLKMLLTVELPKDYP